MLQPLKATCNLQCQQSCLECGSKDIPHECTVDQDAQLDTRVGTLYKQVATPDSLGYLIGFVDLQHLLMGLGWLVLIRMPDRVRENGVKFQSLLFSQCLPKASIEHRPWFLLYMDCKDPPTCNLWHSRNMSYLTDLLYTLHKVCSEHCSAFSAVKYSHFLSYTFSCVLLSLVPRPKTLSTVWERD